MDNPDILVVKYEDLLSQGAFELQRILQWLSISEISEEQINATIHQFSFETMTGRRPGTEDAQQVLRKGVAGDWKTTLHLKL